MREVIVGRNHERDHISTGWRGALRPLLLIGAFLGLVASAVGSAQTFPGATVGGFPGAIPDGTGGPANYSGAPRDVTFDVIGITNSLTNISLSIGLNHSWAGDLDVVLTSPTGAASFVIFSRIGAGGFGSNSDFAGTYVFENASPNNIWSAAGGATIAPDDYRTSVAGPTSNPAANTDFTGAFIGLNTLQINGTWTLRFRDGAGGDSGEVTGASLTLTAPPPSPPAFASANNTTFSQGLLGNFNVTATGSPLPTLSVSGALPSGVSFTPGTGLLSGTPANGTAGVYPLVFTAANGNLPDATQMFTLTVNATAPSITSANSTTFTVLSAGSFNVTSSGSPIVSYSLSGALPAGVSFNSATGVLSGTPGPGTNGSYSLVLTASNGQLPNAIQNFTLTVNAAAPGARATRGVIHTYENTTITTIPDNSCPNTVEQTFVVPESFTVGNFGTISVGVEVAHPSRGHVQLTLVAPNGNSVSLQADNDNDDNLNVMYTSNNDAGNNADDDDDDSLSVAGGSVHYRRLALVAGLDSFYTGPANGTWRLRACDDTANTTGSLNRSRLVLLDASATVPTTQCGSRSIYDWGANGNNAPFTSTTIDDVTITQISTSGEAPSDAAGNPSFLTCNAGGGGSYCATTRGNHNGYYELTMDTTGDTELSAESVSFAFSTPAIGLSLSLLDNDYSGTYEDYMRLEATGPDGLSVPYEMVMVDAANNAFAGDWAEADLGANDNTTVGNVDYLFSEPVSSVRVVYAQGNENETNSTNQWVGISDFSFCAFDYGDAPSSYGTTARNGMSQRSALFLGANPPDGEIAGAPGAGANGDGADEDGIGSFPTYLAAGMTCGAYNTAPGEYCVTVNVTNNTSGAAQVVGWFDFNGDGDFDDAGERSLPRLGGGIGGAADSTFTTGNIAASSGTQNAVLVWSGFGQPTNGQTYARIRLTRDPSFFSDASPAPVGSVIDGETEDYVVDAGTTPVTLAKFYAERLAAGRVRVSWSSASESATLGYFIADKSANDSIRDLNSELVASRLMSTMTPQDYVLELNTAADQLYVVELDSLGKRTVYGPYQVGLQYGDEARLQVYDWSIAGDERVQVAQVENAQRQAGRGGSSLDIEARVTQSGLQRIEFEDLLSAGADWTGVRATALSVRTGNSVVPARLVGGSVFARGTAIEFVGHAVENSLYTKARPYRISVSQPELSVWTQVPGAPLPGASARVGPSSVALDADRYYDFSASGGDPWYFDSVTRVGASAAGNWTLQLPADADPAKPGSLTMDIWGALDFSGSADDHRYRVVLNGRELVEETFDGLRSRSLRIPLPAYSLLRGDNQVRLELLPTGYIADRIMVDRIELKFDADLNAADAARGIYPAAVRAVSDQILVDAFEDQAPQPAPCGTGCKQILMTGFPDADVVVVQETSAGVVEMQSPRVFQQGNGYAVETRPAIGVDGGNDGEPIGGSGLLYAASRSSMARPALRPAADYPNPIDGDPAQYLAITPAGFDQALSPLLAARANQGLTVRSVSLDAIYQHYSDGVIDPEAIRAFLRAAYSRLGTRYVLLAGGDTYDYFDRTGVGSVSLVPTIYRATNPVVFYAPADAVYADVNDDGQPEMALGRMPARTASELATLVAKTLAFESSPHQSSSVFVADRLIAGEDVSYGDISDQLAAAVNADWSGPTTSIYLDNYAQGTAGTAQARSDLLAAVNGGSTWINYFGHAAPSVWSRERLLQPGDLASGLANVGAFNIVTEYGCWGGYFVEPSYNTLGLSWLMPDDRGAAAIIAASGLTDLESDRTIALKMIPAMTTPGVRFGDALNIAKRDMWLSAPEARDVITGLTLLGDPALVVNPD